MDVVVVNWHTPDDLIGFLSTVVDGADGLDVNLVVVNVEEQPLDFEAAKCASRIAGANFNISTVTIATPTNIGYAKACNKGANVGHDPIIAFFNADVRLTHGCLRQLGQHLASGDASIVGPRQVNDRGQIVHAGMFGDNQHTSPRGWHEQDHGQYTDIEPAVTIAGSAYLITRSAWNDLTRCALFRETAPTAEGAFLPTPHYFEETWLSYHARHHGHTVLYDGTVTIIHRWHTSSPVGGIAESEHYPISQAMFRAACDHHGIIHD